MFASAIIGTPRSKRPAGASLCARGLVLLLMLAPVTTGASVVSVESQSDRSSCSVRGVFRAPVSDTLAWSVLSDYEHLERFVRSMRSSHIESSEGNRLTVRQDAVGSVMLFKRRVQVLLDVREQPISRIAFRDVLGKDFKAYDGAWTLAPDSTGCRVTYELRAEPTLPVPKYMCRGMLKKTAQELLEQVRGEMLRRAGAPDDCERKKQ